MWKIAVLVVVLSVGGCASVSLEDVREHPVVKVLSKFSVKPVWDEETGDLDGATVTFETEI